MPKHIHLHLHDAAGFEEAKHPRSHGKFSSVSGAKGAAKSAPATKPAAKQVIPPKPTPNAATTTAAHAKHEGVAKSIVQMAKNDPFLGRNMSTEADYGQPLINRKNPDGSVEFSIRDLGQWVNPPEARNDEDYDWQIPTEKTKKAIGDFVTRIEKQYGVKVSVAGSEKNYLDFTIGAK